MISEFGSLCYFLEKRKLTEFEFELTGVLEGSGQLVRLAWLLVVGHVGQLIVVFAC